MEVPLNITSSPPRQAQTSLSASVPVLFQGANNFTIDGGQYVLGDLHNHTNLGPSSTYVSLPLNLMDDNFSESEIYCNQLLRRKRGFPLYVPGPRQNLPSEYQARGVAIGDVGRVTPEGIFDFFFNIYLPPDDPINAHIPEDFSPMSQYTSVDILQLDYEPGNYVSTSSIRQLEQLNEFPGGDFIFSCGSPQGAVLALPHGAHLEKLDNLDTLRAYVATHAENWYKYVNGPRGRGLANGSLYLVTGWEKAQSWGMASFHDVREEFPLAFKPTARADSTQYRWSGAYGHINPAQKKSYDPSPVNDGPLNQTTFIHGLSISLGKGVWGRLFGKVEICDIVESQLGSANGNPISRASSSGSSLFSWFTGGGEGTSGGTQHVGESGNVYLSDIAPISKIFHPGELINNYILHKVPQASVVMSHDDDWRDILQDYPSAGSNVLTVSEFLRQISDQFNITEKDGATFLTESDSLISVSVCPPTPRSTGPDTLEHSQNPANPDVVLITVVAPPDDLETQGHSESPSSERALHDLPAESIHIHSDGYAISYRTTPPRRRSEDRFADLLEQLSKMEFPPPTQDSHSNTTSRQRTRSFNSDLPITVLRPRTHSDPTPFKLPQHFVLQFNQLEGSAVDSSSSPLAPSPPSSHPSSPAHSSHHPHSPVLPQWDEAFLAPPNAAMYRRPHARTNSLETTSNRSSTPDWDHSSGNVSDDMDSSPHSPTLPAWGHGAFLSPPNATIGRPRASSWGSPESNPSSSGNREGSNMSATSLATDRGTDSSADPRVYDSPYPVENPRTQRPRSWDSQSDRTSVFYTSEFGPPPFQEY